MCDKRQRAQGSTCVCRLSGRGSPGSHPAGLARAPSLHPSATGLVKQLEANLEPGPVSPSRCWLTASPACKPPAYVNISCRSPERASLPRAAGARPAQGLPEKPRWKEGIWSLSSLALRSLPSVWARGWLAATLVAAG